MLKQVDCGADEVVVKGYFRQLLAGCRHCHSQGVCHRDLKPENLLLADHGEHPILKIADFGFSTLLQEMVS
jgi:serine/threonine protein kinase